MSVRISTNALAVALALCSFGSVQAGFTKSVVLDSSYDATQPLQDGTVYIFEKNVEFEGTYDGDDIGARYLVPEPPPFPQVAPVPPTA